MDTLDTIMFNEALEKLRAEERIRSCRSSIRHEEMMAEVARTERLLASALEEASNPATVGDYISWLRGYLSRGKLPTHVYDYPMTQVIKKWYLVHSNLEAIPAYGASSVSLIALKGVKISGKLGHSTIYYMDGFVSTGIVPLYSDIRI